MAIVQVELLCDVAEGGVDLAKNPDRPLKVTRTPRGVTQFKKGAIVTMTHDGAEKWVKRGIAKLVTPARPATQKA